MVTGTKQATNRRSSNEKATNTRPKARVKTILQDPALEPLGQASPMNSKNEVNERQPSNEKKEIETMTNDQSAVIQTVNNLGIPPEQCDPKVNIFTFDKWIEHGRVVEKGQKTCARVPVFGSNEGEEGKQRRFKATARLFHITQTKELTEEERARMMERIEAKKAKRGKKRKNNPKATRHNGPQATNKTAAKANPAEKLRGLADKMQGAIDNKRADRPTHTPRMMLHAGQARLDAEHLERTQQALRGLADLYDAGTVPKCLEGITSKKAVHELTHTRKDTSQGGYYTPPICTGEPREWNEVNRAIFDLLKPKSQEQAKAEDLKSRVDSLKFSNIAGYFPTPKPVIDLMLEKADLLSSLSVLEPSAGHGAIVDELKGHSITAKCIEQNHTLQKILIDKGYDVVDHDTLNHFGKYDRVIMNPPFEKLQDVDHVTHAFNNNLDEFGRLVAIMSPSWTYNSAKKAEDFRALVDQFGTWEKLPPKSFKESGTNIDTVIVILDK